MPQDSNLFGKGRRIWHWFGLAGVLLIAGVYTVYRMRAATPIPVEARFLSALEQQDWEGIYDMSVQEQFTRSGVTRSQFVELMECLSKGLPASYFKGASLERMGGKEDDYSRGYHAVFLTFVNGPSVEGRPVEQVMHAKRDRTGWKMAPNELPMRLARLHGGDASDRWGKMADCFEQVGIKEFWLTLDGPVMRTERIRSYLRGEIDVVGIYRPAPGR